MLRFLTLLATALAIVWPELASAQKLHGTATAVDGDTIDMTGTRIRLAHIDAPEALQTCERDQVEWACGAEATNELASILDGEILTCAVIETDTYGRQVAQCQTTPFDLGREMVRRGMAITLDDAPFEYAEASEIAQRLSYGLWASTFVQPKDWRASNPQASPRNAQSPERPTPARCEPERVYRNEFGCAIKGNRSRRGEWIYHLPGRPYYDRTRPEELFCTESEALAAGYRRSKA